MRKEVNKEFLVAFGIHLRKVRMSIKMSQDDLMNKASLSKNQVGLIERGEINTTIDTVHKIADVLNVPIDELFRFSYKKSNNS